MPLGVCARCLGPVPYYRPVGSYCAACEWVERRRAEESDQEVDGDFLRPEGVTRG